MYIFHFPLFSSSQLLSFILFSLSLTLSLFHSLTHSFSLIHYFFSLLYLVGEEAGGEMEPGSTPDTDVKEHEDEEEKKGQSPTLSDSPPHPPSSAPSGSSTFAPLDLSIRKSSISPPSSRGGRSPSPLSLRIPATRSPSLPHHLPINGSSAGVVTINHQPINSLGPIIIPTSVSSTPPKTSGKGMGSKSGLSSRGSGNRQNPWQTQWMNRSSEQTRDVFTCVWCKESFKSLQDMTLHMKKSPRCGMAGMQQAAAATASGSLSSALSSSALSSSAASQSAVTSHHQHHSSSVPSSPLLSHHPHAHHPVHHLSSSSSSGVAANGSAVGGKGGRSAVSAASSGANSGKSSEPMSSAVLAKNNVALPRKLVRGQDVWLGRGAEQTRQILKCKLTYTSRHPFLLNLLSFSIFFLSSLSSSFLSSFIFSSLTLFLHSLRENCSVSVSTSSLFTFSCSSSQLPSSHSSEEFLSRPSSPPSSHISSCLTSLTMRHV